jgi:acyl carrier protein
MDLPPDVVAQAIEFELTTIREVMAEETGVDFSDFTNTLSFCDIGVDSLLILSIIARIREVIDLQITPSFFVENNTLDEVRLALSDGTWRRQFALETHHSSRAVHSSEDNSRTLGIQCLLYRGVEDPNLWSASEFKSSKVECRGIQSYLKEPGPLGPSDHGGGFRIICRKQRSSLADPFWDAGLTLSELNITLGCPENYEYLSKHDAGVCGRFMTDRQHPGMLPYLRMLLDIAC